MFQKYKAVRQEAEAVKMASCKEEQVLDVPIEWVKKCNGFGMDIGGSVVKIVYRSQDDWKDVEKADEECKTAKLRLVSFPRAELSDALAFLKENCHISTSEAGPANIYSTGVGCNEYGEAINKQLNVKLVNIAEFDCFVKAFVAMAAKLDRKELVYPDCQEAIDVVMRELSIQKEMMTEASKMKEMTQAFNTDGVAEFAEKMEKDLAASEVKERGEPFNSEDIYPCLLVMLGSGVGSMLVNKDGTFKMNDGSNRGGRMFFGLGQMLTGAKNYEELIELAAKGNNKNVDIYMSDLINKDSEVDDIYTIGHKYDLDNIVYCFGKGVGAKIESFNKADLACSLLHTMVLDLTHWTHLVAQMDEVNTIFFCGSMMNTAVVRRMMTEELTRRTAMMAFMRPEAKGGKEFYFLKHGPHLGALGALINNVEGFLQPGAGAEAKNPESPEAKTPDSPATVEQRM